MAAPVYLHYFGPVKIKHPAGDQAGTTGRLFDKIAGSIIKIINKNKWVVLIFLLGTAFFVGLFTNRVKVDNDLLGYFKKDSTIRMRSRLLHEKMAGAQTFFIRISSGLAGTFKQPENLAQLALVQKYVKKMGWFDKTLSLADHISLIHREMNDGNEKYFDIPDSPDLVSQYLLLLRRDEIDRFVTTDLSEVNILVRHNLSSSHELADVLEQLKDYLEKNINTHFKFGFTGENILVNTAADSMASGQFKSLLLLMAVIFIIMSLLFVNIKAGALSLIPNFYPIVSFFGIMGILDIPLNTGTAMVAAISIGIAVDDTVHFMVRYNKEMRTLQSQDRAMEVCIRSEIRPVLSTSIALALGFVVLCSSNFVPIIHFGFLSAMVMLFALIGDMFVTPILLSSTQLITLWDMMGLNLKEDVIKRSMLFTNLKSWQIKKIILLGKEHEKDTGELAVVRGEEGSSMFLLIEGRAQVLSKKDENGKEFVIADLGPGDVFGEIALVESGPRSADIRAVEPIKYIEIDWNGLKRIQRIYPRIAGRLFLNLARILGRRLVSTSDMLLLSRQLSKATMLHK